jgi:DNA repair protein RadC
MLGRVEGIGPAAAALVSLVMRLATRSMEPSEGEKLDCPDSVREYLRHRMGTLRRERFHALFLDSGNRLLASEDLEFGTVDRASVHPRNLVEKVLSSNATAVILVHNHPGGRLEASREDVQLTKRLSGLAESLGFTILDHLIVTDRDILSLREEGLLDFT